MSINRRKRISNRTMHARLLFILLAIVLVTCKNIEDVKPSERNTLIHFYGSDVSYEGIKAVVDTDGGFIIAGNIIKNDFVKDIILIKTDSKGKKLWEKKFINGSVSDLKVLPDGYLIYGDSIDYQPQSDRISEIVNTSA